MAGTRKATPRASEIGRRLRMIRRRRGMSIEVAAGLAGLSKPYWSQLENGLRAFERRSLFGRLARALDCAVADITGEPYLPVDRDDASGMVAIPGLEQALHDCTLDDVPDIPARPVGELVQAARMANSYRDQVQYALAGRELGAVQTELQITVAVGSPDDRRAALRALVELGIVGYEIAKNLGHPTLAVEAAERGFAAAQLLGDPTLLGFAGWYRSLALMRVGAHRRASSALNKAAAVTEPLVRPDGPDTLPSEIHGLVHLTSAAHAARQGDADTAHSHLDDATQLAAAVGERNGLRQHFGPTNVSIWRIGVGVELCEGAALVESEVDPAVLGSRNRTAGYHFDLARALSQEGGRRDREVLHHLDMADRTAPSRIRHDPIARSLLDTVEARTRASMWELSSLRHRWGMSAA